MERQKIRTLPDDLKSMAQELINNKFPDKAQVPEVMTSTVKNKTTAELNEETLARDLRGMEASISYGYIPRTLRIEARGFSGPVQHLTVAIPEGDSPERSLQYAITNLRRHFAAEVPYDGSFQARIKDSARADYMYFDSERGFVRSESELMLRRDSYTPQRYGMPRSAY